MFFFKNIFLIENFYLIDFFHKALTFFVMTYKLQVLLQKQYSKDFMDV